jgi:hypothetical protein
MPIVRADSSAKMVPVGTTIYPNVAAPSSAFTDPFLTIDSTGGTTGLGGFYGCDANGVTPDYSGYWCYFRPDRTK